MTTPLWVKPGAEIDPATMRYMAGRDVELDRRLLPHDIRASIAHVRGLRSIGALPGADADAILHELRVLADNVRRGEFVLDDRFEDGHSAIEARLVERLGAAGGRVHLGRSRNDQVLVAMSLYVRAELARVHSLSLDAACAALERARELEHVVMPGYTHLQRAVPSTAGLWMASFAESYIENATLLRLSAQWFDACPLGTAAGYGVNLDLPRDAVADELGFARVVVNPMHAQACRGSHDVQALAALWQVAQTVRRLAWDLSLFASAEFGFVRLPDRATTGSSIMPNKRNPDLAELLRTLAAEVGGRIAELMQIVSLPSGYHRDLQSAKAPVIAAFEAVSAAMTLVPPLIRDLECDRARMRAAIEPAMLATDEAVRLAAGGVPFREAYRAVAERLGSLSDADADRSVRERVSLGGTGNLGLDILSRRIDEERERRLAGESDSDAAERT